MSLRARLVRSLGGDPGADDSVILTCSGTGAVEAMLNGLHGKALVLANGRYSERMAAILQRLGIPTVVARFDPLRPLEPDEVASTLDANPDTTHLICTHHETEFGVLNPLSEIGAVAARYERPLYVDAISSVGCHAFDLASCGISACAISSNKGLESIPGISFVVGRAGAFESSRGHARSFYLGLYDHWMSQRSGGTLFTPATNAIFAFDEALRRLETEGYEGRVARYAALASLFREGLSSIGLSVLDAGERGGSNVVTLVRRPPAVDSARLIAEADKLGLVIHISDAHLANGTIPLSLMGAVREADVAEVVSMLQSALERAASAP